MYPYDRGLKLTWAQDTTFSDEKNERNDEMTKINEVVSHEFPSIKQFLEVASLAYDVYKNSSTDIPDVLRGFALLAKARRKKLFNGYQGAAYINKDTRQIIVGHMGTPFSISMLVQLTSALLTNLFGIMGNQEMAQVSSAMTFAHKIATFGTEKGYSVFFTGHSLGAWLAQITCFSTMYLKVEFKNHKPNQFISIEDKNRSNIYIPYTVVFDSPGAHQFLYKMRNVLFRAQDASAQCIVEQLPIEIFLFHENLVNTHKKHIGTVFILKGNPKIKPILLGWNTHPRKYIYDIVMQNVESEVVDKRVIDFTLSWVEWACASWNKTERNCKEPELNKFSKFFLNDNELQFASTARRDYQFGQGKFDGINTFDEMIANELIKTLSAFPNQDPQMICWSVGETFHCPPDTSRQKLIPKIRHVVKCLNEGRIWWNAVNIETPDFVFERLFCRSTDRLQQSSSSFLWSLLQNKITKMENILKDQNWNNPFLLITDYPGTGKSWALKELETILRKSKDKSRIILRLKLKSTQETLNSFKEQYIPLSWENILKHLGNVNIKALKHTMKSSSHANSTIKLYLLLDGVDEVCSEYGDTLLRLYKALQGGQNQKLLIEQIIMSTRPHYKKQLELDYKAKSLSLCPIDIQTTKEFIQDNILPKHLDTCRVLSSQLLSLLDSPQIIFAAKLILQNETRSNTLMNLIRGLLRCKSEHFLEQKENFRRFEADFDSKVKALIEDKLSHYNRFAIKHLLNKKTPENETPTLKTLFSHGILTMDINKQRTGFEHNKFAEFFVANMTEHDLKDASLTQEDFDNINLVLDQSTLQDVLCSCPEDRWN